MAVKKKGFAYGKRTDALGDISIIKPSRMGAQKALDWTFGRTEDVLELLGGVHLLGRWGKVSFVKKLVKTSKSVEEEQHQQPCKSSFLKQLGIGWEKQGRLLLRGSQHKKISQHMLRGMELV